MNLCRFARQGGVAAVVASGLVAATADASVYFTIYTLNTPYTATSPDVTQVLMSWSTNITSGVVDQGDLTDWSISFLSGGNLFYTDNIVTAGAVQSIGGVNRGIADILFNFNLDTLTAGDFSEFRAQWYDGCRYRTAVAYVGEGGILPNVPYRVDGAGKFLAVEP